MSKLCEELELKFFKIETKIEAYLKHVNELYKDEIELLNAKFQGSEINSANEIQSRNEEFNKMLTLFEKLKINKLEFKPKILRSNEICIWKLINREYLFAKLVIFIILY